jgi:hypothetical protein
VKTLCFCRSAGWVDIANPPDKPRLEAATPVEALLGSLRASGQVMH